MTKFNTLTRLIFADFADWTFSFLEGITKRQIFSKFKTKYQTDLSELFSLNVILKKLRKRGENIPLLNGSDVWSDCTGPSKQNKLCAGASDINCRSFGVF